MLLNYTRSMLKGVRDDGWIIKKKKKGSVGKKGKKENWREKHGKGVILLIW